MAGHRGCQRGTVPLVGSAPVSAQTAPGQPSRLTACQRAPPCSALPRPPHPLPPSPPTPSPPSATSFTLAPSTAPTRRALRSWRPTTSGRTSQRPQGAALRSRSRSGGPVSLCGGGGGGGGGGRTSQRRQGAALRSPDLDLTLGPVWRGWVGAAQAGAARHRNCSRPGTAMHAEGAAVPGLGEGSRAAQGWPRGAALPSAARAHCGRGVGGDGAVHGHQGAASRSSSGGPRPLAPGGSRAVGS